MAPKHTDEQVHFINAVLYGDEHLLLRSTAGSGKTTSLIEAAQVLPDPPRSMYFTYNRAATEGVQRLLPSGMRARNVHSHGFSLLAQAAKEAGAEINVDDRKTARLIAALSCAWITPAHVPTLSAAWDTWREEALHESVEDTTELARMVAWEREKPETVRYRDWMNGLRQAMRELRTLSLADWHTNWTCDYTDMLWLTCELGYGRNTLTCAVVDEAQDFTALRTRLVAHLTGLRAGRGRLIAAGDPEQEVFSYSMHRRGSLWTLAQELGALELHLSVSFRCPRDVTHLAQRVSSFIRSAPNAVAGQVLHVPAEAAFLPDTPTTFLARHNGTLLEYAARFQAAGRSASLADPGLGKLLAGAVKAALPTGTPLAEIAERLDRTQLTPPLIRAVEFLCQRQGGAIEQCGLLATLAALTTGPSHDTYLSVHRAKGREWRDVTVLRPEDLSVQRTHDDPEACVTFVALTRSKHTLRLAYGPRAWERGDLLVAQDVSEAVKMQLWQNPAPTVGPPAARTTEVALIPLILPPDPQGPPTDAGWPDLLGVKAGWPVHVRRLREELTALLRVCHRPALGTYLNRQLSALTGVADHQWVLHDQELYTLTRRYVRSGALPIPPHYRPQGSLQVIVTNTERWRAYITPAMVVGENDASWQVRLPGGEEFILDRATGERAGVPFHPSQPFLHPRELQAPPQRYQA